MTEAMQEQQFNFLLEEYRSLKAELASLVKESRVLQTGAVAGTAAVYAWLAKVPDEDIVAASWWIPVLFPMLGIFRHSALIVRIMHIAAYIQQVEQAVCKGAPRGWETFLAGKRKSLPGLLISTSSIAFWIALLSVTVIVGNTFS